MNSKTQYRIIAVLICIVIYALYISLSVSMDWGHGGGYLVLFILVGILRAVWKGVNNLADEKDKTNETPAAPQEETLPEIPGDAEAEQIPVEDETPIPVEDLAESIPQEESEYLPPIPDIEEEEITSVTPPEESETFNQQPKTHWQKFRLYYIIAVALCVVAAVTIPVTVHIHKQKKIEILLSEAIKVCENTFFDLALQHLDKAYTLNPKSYAVNYYIGCVHCHKHNYEPARKHLETAYLLNKKKEDYILSFDTIDYDRLLYYYYISLKDYQQADNQSDINKRTLIAQEYLTLYPNECGAYRCMAYEYGLKNDFNKVNEYFDKILKNNPISVQLTDYMSDIYSQLKAMKYDVGPKEYFVTLLFTEADRNWALEKYIKIRPEMEFVWKYYDNEVADQVFPLEWQNKIHPNKQQVEDQTNISKQHTEKTNRKSSSVHNGYKYVDLGLSVKWATENIGANKPEEYGDYFAWGEIKSKNSYTWTNYKWCKGTNNRLTKYNSTGFWGWNDGKSKLEQPDDVAHIRWGGKWRIPTKSEWQELIDNCNWEWTSLNGVNGYIITSNKQEFSDQSIFIPAAGHMYENKLEGDRTSLSYISSQCDEQYSFNLFATHSNKAIVGYNRQLGSTIRPVSP